MRKLQLFGLVWKTFQPVIKKRLSARMRRAIFISSLLAVIRNISNPSKELTERLNEIFHVAHDPMVMQLPMVVHGFIWTDVSEDSVVFDMAGENVRVDEIEKTVLAHDDLVKVARYFIEKAPSWLRYGSDQEMEADVQKLIQQIPQFRMA